MNTLELEVFQQVLIHYFGSGPINVYWMWKLHLYWIEWSRWCKMHACTQFIQHKPLWNKFFFSPGYDSNRTVTFRILIIYLIESYRFTVIVKVSSNFNRNGSIGFVLFFSKVLIANCINNQYNYNRVLFEYPQIIEFFFFWFSVCIVVLHFKLFALWAWKLTFVLSIYWKKSNWVRISSK